MDNSLTLRETGARVYFDLGEVPDENELPRSLVILQQDDFLRLMDRAPKVLNRIDSPTTGNLEGELRRGIKAIGGGPVFPFTLVTLGMDHTGTSIQTGDPMVLKALAILNADRVPVLVPAHQASSFQRVHGGDVIGHPLALADRNFELARLVKVEGNIANRHLRHSSSGPSTLVVPLEQLQMELLLAADISSQQVIAGDNGLKALKAVNLQRDRDADEHADWTKRWSARAEGYRQAARHTADALDTYMTEARTAALGVEGAVQPVLRRSDVNFIHLPSEARQRLLAQLIPPTPLPTTRPMLHQGLPFG